MPVFYFLVHLILILFFVPACQQHKESSVVLCDESTIECIKMNYVATAETPPEEKRYLPTELKAIKDYFYMLNRFDGTVYKFDKTGKYIQTVNIDLGNDGYQLASSFDVTDSKMVIVRNDMIQFFDGNSGYQLTNTNGIFKVILQKDKFISVGGGGFHSREEGFLSIYDYEGQFIDTYGKSPYGHSKLNRDDYSVYVDSEGNKVVAALKYEHAVIIYNEKGKILQTINIKNDISDKLDYYGELLKKESASKLIKTFGMNISKNEIYITKYFNRICYILRYTFSGEHIKTYYCDLKKIPSKSDVRGVVASFLENEVNKVTAYLLVSNEDDTANVIILNTEEVKSTI